MIGVTKAAFAALESLRNKKPIEIMEVSMKRWLTLFLFTTLLAACSTPAAVTDIPLPPTVTLQPTETLTPTPEATATAPEVAMPSDVADLDPGGTIYKQVGDKIVNADGSVAYQLDSKNEWQLVDLKYGSWENGQPQDVSLDNLECVKNGTPCAYKMPFPAFRNWEGVTIRTTTTGAIDRVPFLDPATGQILGTQDRVWLKTRSESGQDISFPYTVQLVPNNDVNKNISYGGRLLINYLTDGEDVQTTKVKAQGTESVVELNQLAATFSQSTNIDLAMFDQFPPDSNINQETTQYEGSLGIMKKYYSNPNYQKALKTFYDFLLGKTSTYTSDPGFTLFTGGSFWPKGWLQ